MKKLTFNDTEYEILETYIRTKGSMDQRIFDVNEATSSNREFEDRRKFYLVQEHIEAAPSDFHPVKKDQFWIKEYCGDLGYSIEYEYRESSRLSKHTTSLHDFGYCKAHPALEIDRERNMLLFDYLGDFDNMNVCAHTSTINAINALIVSWVSETPVYNYDLCHNNVMFKKEKSGNIHVRLIDFEYSPDRNPKKELGLK